jgi:glycosyltransferase involved in cell wall biosynthesis
LAEALAHGLPAIGFAECAGVRDLIVHGRSGLLAEGNEDPETLALVLDKAMSRGELRRSMGSEAIASVKRLDPPRIFSQWEQLLFEVAEAARLH